MHKTFLAILCVAAPALAADEIVKPDPSILIVRDPAVRHELDLNERQQEAADRAIAELNDLVFATRDDNSSASARKVIQALQKAERRLNGALSEQKFRRLQSIVLRVQGYRALFENTLARRLKITNEQQQDIRKVLESADREIAELRTAGGDKPDGVITQAIKLKEQEGEARVHALLSEEQQKQWAQLRGAPFDISQLSPPAPRPPALAGIAAWINSEPLTLAALRGKVVLLHFWTFGDKTCVENYPWYRDWHKAYATQGLVIIGVHTPEFPDQASAEAVTAQARLNQLDFPIALDNNAETWNAWVDPAWPAIYLIDRRGCVRLWWYGAIKRSDADGAKYLQGQIEALLAEN